MKVYRFMSGKEFKKYLEGEILTNDTHHRAKTNSVGFCFCPMKEKPEKAVHHLSGIVTLDYCVVFDVDKKLLNESWGIYAKDYKTLEEILNNYGESVKLKEYCTTTYSNKDFKMIKYAKLDYFNRKSDDFDWQENIKPEDVDISDKKHPLEILFDNLLKGLGERA